MRDLAGRVAVVTGAASGIGKGLATRFADEGMKVVLADVEEPALHKAVDELKRSGADAVGVVTDVTDRIAVENLAAATLAAFGAVHVVCNNAGVETGGAFERIPERSWRWVIDVNVLGVVFGCQVFLPLLRDQGDGHIVNTASVTAFESSIPTMAPYTASKFAVLGLTESLAHELRARGDRVGVSVLVPGPVRTQIGAAERNRPSDVAGTYEDPIRKAAMDGAAHVIATEGIDPMEVGSLVVDGVREDRFFILTDPKTAFRGVDTRVEWMRSGKFPLGDPPVL